MRAALRTVVDPCSIATGVPINLIEMGLLKNVEISGGEVEVRLRLTSPMCWQAGQIVEAVEEAVGRVAGVERVVCSLDPAPWEWTPDLMSASARARLRRVRPLPSRP